MTLQTHSAIGSLATATSTIAARFATVSRVCRKIHVSGVSSVGATDRLAQVQFPTSMATAAAAWSCGSGDMAS